MDSQSIYIKEVQGRAVYNQNHPVSLSDYFHIGSCSKSVLAVIAGKIFEEGRIAWDTKFFELFPELKNEANKEYYEITLRDLFLCEAGILPFTSGEELFPDFEGAESKRFDFIKYLIQQQPASKKNKTGRFNHLYSNASYTMASAMLEKVSGKNYEELVDEYIANQMGLDLYIGWPNRLDSRQPWGHLINGKRITPFSPDNEYAISQLITPAGDLAMPPLEYAKYIQLHLKGLKGEASFLKKATYEYINFGHIGFSLGVVNSKMGGYSYAGMDGSAGTFFCRSIIVPESDFAFTIMVNAGSGSGRMKAVDWLTKKIVKKHFSWWWRFWF